MMWIPIRQKFSRDLKNGVRLKQKARRNTQDRMDIVFANGRFFFTPGLTRTLSNPQKIKIHPDVSKKTNCRSKSLTRSNTAPVWSIPNSIEVPPIKKAVHDSVVLLFAQNLIVD